VASHPLTVSFEVVLRCEFRCALGFATNTLRFVRERKSPGDQRQAVNVRGLDSALAYRSPKRALICWSRSSLSRDSPFD